MSGLKVMGALDQAWAKFKPFCQESMVTINIDKNLIEKTNTIFSRDILIFLPMLKSFFEKHHTAFDEENTLYFVALAELSYPGFDINPIPEEIAKKFFLFARVFRSLIADLNKNS